MQKETYLGWVSYYMPLAEILNPLATVCIDHEKVHSLVMTKLQGQGTYDFWYGEESNKWNLKLH